MKRILYLALLSILGLTIGFVTGRKQTAHPSATQQTASVSSQEPDHRSRSQGEPTIIESAETPQRSAFERMVKLLEDEIPENNVSAKIKQLVQSMTLSEVTSAITKAQQLADGTTRRRLLGFLIPKWAELEPGVAIDHLLDANSESDDFLDEAFRAWAKKDPRAAYEGYQSRLKTRNVPPFFGSVLASIFHQWQSHDFEEAWQEFEKLPSNHAAVNNAFNGLSVNWNSPKRHQVAEKVMQIGNRHKKFTVLSVLMRSWGQDDVPLEEIGAWLATVEIPSGNRRQFERELAQSRIYSAPKAAADWLMAGSKDKWRSRDINTVVNSWASTQPNACGEWLGQLGSDEHTDLGVSNFAKQIAKDDADSALEWARTITDEKLRNETIAKVSVR